MIFKKEGRMTYMIQKAIFLDLDDTLLNSNKEISPGNRAAIDRALAAGHKVTITTGRPLVGSIRLAEELGLTRDGCYLICFNGGIIYDMFRRETVFQQVFSKRLAPPVFAEANRRQLHIQTYSQWDTLVEPNRDDDREINWYCGRIKVTYSVIPSVEQLEEDPLKMLAICLEDQQPLKDFQRWLNDHYGDQLDTFFSCRQLLEIVPKGTSKGAAVVRLCGLLGIPVEHSIACGDAANDLSMIQMAGLGVAMANGVDEVKAAADYITEHDCNHDGIAEVIERFMLASPAAVKD